LYSQHAKMSQVNNFCDLSNKVALVTGASSGIGAATAKVLAELGANISFSYHQNEAGAKEIKDEVERAGGKAIAIRADVREAAQIRALVARATEELGPIDILVNNAGSLIGRQEILEMGRERWDEVINLNLTSAMLCAQAVAPQMIARRSGAIVNVVSIAGRTGGGPGAGAYAAAKGGLIALTKSLAKELAPYGVRVNAISPGVIDTPFHKMFSTPEMIRSFVASIPLGRIGTAMECARVVAFLASDAASFVIGETIEVNGGQLML
jgi:3-oxoacyl-[acyl-carrier protein] reductase